MEAARQAGRQVAVTMNTAITDSETSNTEGRETHGLARHTA